MSDDLHSMKYSQILMENAKLGKSLSGEDYPVALLANVTANQLKDILEYALRRQGIKAVVTPGDYDNILQDAAKFPEARALVVFWETANILDGLQVKFDAMDAAMQKELTAKVKSELSYFFQTVAQRPLVIMNTFSTLAFTHRRTVAGAFEHFAAELNTYLRQQAPGNTVLIDLDKIIARLSVERAIDYRYFYSSKALYTIDFYKDYAAAIAPYLLAPLGKSKKAVILDCDNTLWKGILGEDGLNGIDMSPESNDGRIFYEVQSLLLGLQKQGILLGLCSKNNPEEVDQVLAEHPDIQIKEEHLSIKKVNWEDKASNLRAIAAELNIGIDSLVFIDDSDFEVNLIREQLPEVTAVQVPAMLAQYPDTVRGILPQFVTLSSTAEDGQRAQMYSDEKQRQEGRSGFADLEDYLKSLELKMTIYQDPAEHLPRVAQLTQKTNQFNLTTRRYTEADIQGYFDSDSSAVYAFRLEDKFGDYGLTGVAVVRYEDGGETAVIDTLLMSCRVIGRNVEFAFFDRIMQDIRARGAKEVRAEYLRTPKNDQVNDLYDRIGFTRTDGNDTQHSYTLTAADYAPPDIPYIDVIIHPAGAGKEG